MNELDPTLEADHRRQPGSGAAWAVEKSCRVYRRRAGVHADKAAGQGQSGRIDTMVEISLGAAFGTVPHNQRPAPASKENSKQTLDGSGLYRTLTVLPCMDQFGSGS